MNMVEIKQLQEVNRLLDRVLKGKVEYLEDNIEEMENFLKNVIDVEDIQFLKDEDKAKIKVYTNQLLEVL